MADIEKVIKGLEKWIDDPLAQNAEIEPQLVHDALELLKELIDERHYYEEWKEGYGSKEIVRCKDCKHRTRRICNNIELWECNHIRYELVKCGVTDNWFCADGERKDE